MNPALIIATIELDNDAGRGEIQAIETDAGWEISVATDEGIEDPGLPAFETLDDAKTGIVATWGYGPWDLRWI